MFRRGLVSLLICPVALLVATGPVQAASPARSLHADASQVGLPAVGAALARRVAVRRLPRQEAPVRAVMKAFRFDFRPTVFFVVDRVRTNDGEWLKVMIPGRPNGRTGWVRGSRLRLRQSAGPVRIVIDRSQRRLRLYRGDRLVMAADVAVGTPDAPTPLGRFYVTAAFRPADDFLGPWAFETSAYAAISDWPRGGIVGLHGTSEPGSVGERASHGCIRVYNDVILALKQRVRPGTPIRIRA